MYEVNSVGVPTGAANPHGNAFLARGDFAGTEKEAQRRVNSATARFWRVVNPEQAESAGQAGGYRLVPGENCPPLVQPDAKIMRRAGFTANQVWVTPYDPEERSRPAIIRTSIQPETACRTGRKRIARSMTPRSELVVRVRAQSCAAS